MPVQRETRLVRKMVKAIEKAHPEAFCTKIHGGPYQRSGLPDLLVVIDGRLAALEAKAPAPGESDEHARERVTEIQQATLDEMARAGVLTRVVISVDEAVRAADDLAPMS